MDNEKEMLNAIKEITKDNNVQIIDVNDTLFVSLVICILSE